jgi:predicted permease
VGLASLRLVHLPALTLGFATLLGLESLPREVVVLMNGTPIAVNLIVLSARYRFFEEEMATLILISSVGALITMNLWTAFL